jgi:glycosyltransferase involved in cell wall biosynthesis
MKFIIQAKDKPLWISKYSCAEHKDFVAYNDLPKTFSQADFLILPYDFSPKSIQFIGYSMPTKATEYMISGTPIIIFSPEQTAVVKYARKYNWAKIVTNDDTTQLSKVIISLLQDKNERENLAKRAITVAKENHSLAKKVTAFRSIFLKLMP